MKLLMITGDRALAQGREGPFYYMLEEFSKYWERIDIICPRLRQGFGGQVKLHVQKFFNNVYVHSSNLPLILQPWFIFKKGKEIFKEQKFDLFTIHAYPPFYNDIGGLLLYDRIKTPYVLEVMHINGFPRASGLKEIIYKILTRWFVSCFAKKSAAVRVINYRQVSKFLIKSGVDEKKIKVAPAFYIDFNIFKPEAIEKKYDVVFSGRLVKNKGVFLLLGAVNNLKFKIKNLKLIIVGDGPLKSKIKKYIINNNLQNNIELAGWLPTANDLAKIYNQSKIMVMPSFNEGGPRVTLEAMACKVPVITSKVGIMLDIIKDGENGMFIDWNIKNISERIMLLLEDNDLRSRIAGNGYQTVQQFERKKVIENYAKTYQNLLHSA